ncbi:MAG: FHA domain-containing protein [Verrucomicrobiota bacterium]
MYLRYNDEHGLAQTFELQEKTVIIGRSKSADIQLFDTKMSREHCEIVYEDDRYVLRDLKSKNGTHLNNDPIERVTLEDGDRIQIGSITIVFTDTIGGGTTVALNAVEQEMDDGHGYNTILRGIVDEIDDDRKKGD